MKISLVNAPKTVMSNPYGLHGYFAWPTVARLKNGRIAVTASGFRLQHVCPFGKAVISFSDDEGESYTLPAPVIDTPLDDRDSGLIAFGESGVLVSSFNNTVNFQRGIAKGKPDEAYRTAYLDTVDAQAEEKYLGATFRISTDNGVSFGELHKSPITSPHGPIECRDGRILWVGRTFSRENAMMENDCVCAYTVNTETGEMEYVGRIGDVIIDGEKQLSCEPHVIELDTGVLLCHIRVQTPRGTRRTFTVYQSESHDGGATWSDPRKLLPDMGGAPAHIIRHSSGALISVYGYRNYPFGIKAMFSYDGGKSWDTDHDIYTNEASWDLGYPSTVELNDGSLLTVFYAKASEDAPAVIMQQKWRFEK